MSSICYFCSKNSRSFFAYYCDDCSLLRRMLIVYDPKKSIEILKRTLIRDQNQIDNKIETILNEKLPVIQENNNETDDEQEPKKDLVLRNKKKIIKNFTP